MKRTFLIAAVLITSLSQFGYGQFQTVILTGDVGGGDLRRIQSLGLEGINDDGLILMKARFEDGSVGYFTSDIAAVPAGTFGGLASSTARPKRWPAVYSCDVASASSFSWL